MTFSRFSGVSSSNISCGVKEYSPSQSAGAAPPLYLCNPFDSRFR